MSNKADHWAVVVDDNLVNIDIGPDDGYYAGSHITLILPHIRGVGQIFASGHHGDGLAFSVFTHDSKNPIYVYGAQFAFDDEHTKLIRATLASVRHELLAAINKHYHRPYCGEQLSLL